MVNDEVIALVFFCMFVPHARFLTAIEANSKLPRLILHVGGELTSKILFMLLVC